jgi:simple sugar transport system permease protein
MIAAILASASPIMLAGLGALLTDIAGSLGVFMEGFMILGSFIAWTAAHATGSAFIGTAAAAFISTLLGWALARFVRFSLADPFIVALALNLAAGGIADALSVAWFGTKGVLSDPSVPAAAAIHLPLIGSVPILGALLSGHGPFVYLSWAAVLATALVVSRTRVGLRLRAAGRSSEALAERGVDPRRYRAGAWAAAAALGALAGAALTFRIGAYAPGGVAGRGWIALAVVYLGFRNAWGVAAAAILFAAAEQLSSTAQGVGSVPATLLLGLPSALALVLYALSTWVKAVRGRRIQ